MSSDDRCTLEQRSVRMLRSQSDALLNDPTANMLLDAATKGIPVEGAPVRLSDIASRGWNVLAGDCPLPLAVIRTDIVAANSAWMMAFAHRHGLLIAPHGKTTMAPALFALQIADGAWAITVATTQQMQVCLNAGHRRIILANQPMGQAINACFQALTAHADLELYVLADSVQGVALLAREAARCAADRRALRVLIEIGAAGGRTGCRDLASALEVARAVSRVSGLMLAGVEAFEGLLATTDVVSQFIERLVHTAQAIDAQDLFAGDIVMSAGGSAFFDLAAVGLKSVKLSRRVHRVLRSGCYLTHDEFGYAAEQKRILSERRLELPEGTLLPALHVWSYVQSRPDADKAILTMGKRDVGYDSGWPQPVAWFRPDEMVAPQPLSEDYRITGLNDQHAHMSIPPTATLTVGDMVAVGIAHPCTTFERWQVLMLVNRQLDIVGAVRTCF